MFFLVYPKKVNASKVASTLHQLGAIIIRGKPDFKAWIDQAQVATQGYSLYLTYPPYENLQTYPPNGQCLIVPGEWKICVYANNLTGQVSAYSWDGSSKGSGRWTYAYFNGNPIPSNSPQLYKNSGFRIGAYWSAYGHLGPAPPSYSYAYIKLQLYYYNIGWQLVRTERITIDSLSYPNTDVYYRGSVVFPISPLPSGVGLDTVVVSACIYAVNYDGSGEADFFIGTVMEILTLCLYGISKC